MANLDLGQYYRITRQDNGNSVVVKRGIAPPELTSVGGRWNVVQRPRRNSFTTWDGQDPYRMDLPILIDGWDEIKSVEDDIAFINNLRLSPGDLVPPPTIKVEGAVPVKNATWILETDTDYSDSGSIGDSIIWHEDGYRLRQIAVLHLLQFVPVGSLAIKAPATKRTHIVKQGETLKTISRAEYGTTKYWSSIQKANNIRDPKKIKKGQVLKIPAIVNP